MRIQYLSWRLTLILIINLSMTISIFIEMHIADKIPRVYSNVSLGLKYNTNLAHPCSVVQDSDGNNVNTEIQKIKMHYTSNRRPQKETLSDAIDGHIQAGFVVALGGHSAGGGTGIYNYGDFGALNGLMAVFDSWIDNYFSVASNSSSLILLFDERDFHRHSANTTITRKDYLDIIVQKNMGATPVDCVRVKKHHILSTTVSTAENLEKLKQHGCSNKLSLDQGYRVYYINPTSSDGTASLYCHPIILFAGIYKFPAPAWAQGKNEDELYEKWRPKGLRRAFQTNYGYVKLTNWYSYHMLTLDILDFFDYVGKLDSDVTFNVPFPEPNLPRRMIEKQARVMLTHNNWYHDAPQVCNGLTLCLDSYITQENKICQSIYGGQRKYEWIARGEAAHGLFWEANMNTTFRSHFTLLWLGIYAAPETVAMAKFWNDFHPWGMWDYRWGDQQYWPRPLALFSEQDIATDYDHFSQLDADAGVYMSHKPYPLFLTVRTTSYFHINGSNKETRLKLYTEAAKTFKI